MKRGVYLLLIASALAAAPGLVILPDNGAWMSMEGRTDGVTEAGLDDYGFSISSGTVWYDAAVSGTVRFEYASGLLNGRLHPGNRVILHLKEGANLRGEILRSDGGMIYLKTNAGIVAAGIGNILYWTLETSEEPRRLVFVPAESAGKRKDGPVKYGFQTPDLSWRAEYELRWDNRRKARFVSVFRIVNRGEGRLTEADVTLLAGDINHERANYDVYAKSAIRGTGAPMMESAAPVPQASGANYIFHLQEPVYIAPAAEWTEPLAETAEIIPVRTGIIQGNNFSGSGEVPRHADLEIAVDTEKLNRILPAGLIRMFDENGVFAGEARIGNTPEGETVRFSPGKMFDVVYERKTEELNRDRNSASGTIEYTVRNRGDQDVSLRIRDDWHGSWTITESTHDYDKISSGRLEFPLKLKAGETVVVRYGCYVKYR